MEKAKILALGIAEDVADKVVALADEELNAEKAKLTDKEAELKMATDKVAELTETVKKFDGVDVEKLKADMAAQSKKYDDDINALKLDNALTVALAGSGAKDAEIVKGLIDRSIIKLDGGNLVGVTEQLETLKKDKAFLFESAADDGGADEIIDTGTQHVNPSKGETFGFNFTGVRPATK